MRERYRSSLWNSWLDESETAMKRRLWILVLVGSVVCALITAKALGVL